jgi:hypothetical protein
MPCAVPIPGGLFSTGDGHASQGAGEVGNTEIECSNRGCAIEVSSTLGDESHNTTFMLRYHTMHGRRGAGLSVQAPF